MMHGTRVFDASARCPTIALIRASAKTAVPFTAQAARCGMTDDTDVDAEAEREHASVHRRRIIHKQIPTAHEQYRMTAPTRATINQPHRIQRRV